MIIKTGDLEKILERNLNNFEIPNVGGKLSYDIGKHMIHIIKGREEILSFMIGSTTLDAITVMVGRPCRGKVMVGTISLDTLNNITEVLNNIETDLIEYQNNGTYYD